METPMTLSRLADMIIVISFFSVGFTAFLYLVVDTIMDMVSGIKARRKARKERKGKELEQAKEQEA
jgi:phosphatidylglycerophosphate synthase